MVVPVVDLKISQKSPGWWLGHPSEKYESQLGWLFPIYGKIKNVPNHQPVFFGVHVFVQCLCRLTDSSVWQMVWSTAQLLHCCPSDPGVPTSGKFHLQAHGPTAKPKGHLSKPEKPRLQHSFRPKNMGCCSGNQQQPLVNLDLTYDLTISLFHVSSFIFCYILIWYIPGWWLGHHSKKYLSIGIIIPNIWENIKCSKPPTRYIYIPSIVT